VALQRFVDEVAVLKRGDFHQVLLTVVMTIK
jgi:hypothetical protein